jgi:hypothetical protein
MNTRTRFLGAAIGVGLIAAIGARGVFRHAGAVIPMALAASTATAASAPALPATIPAASAAGQTANELKTSHDYWQLAQQTVLRARAGDAHAAYQMWVIHAYCHNPNTSGFVAGANHHVNTLSEAIADGDKGGITPDQIPQLTLNYNRCVKFYTQDPVTAFGSPHQWLSQATKAGVPMAEAETAELMYQQETLSHMRRQDDPTIAADPILGTHVTSDIDPKTLMKDAVTKGDPNVLIMLAGMQDAFNPGRQTTAESFTTANAFIYLACNMGADCSQYGTLVPVNCDASGNGCTNVPSEIMQRVSNDITPVIRRADEISLALKNRNWDQLGLGS